MADAFIKAAEAKSHEVTRFDCAQMKFKSCRACDTCFKTGRACSFPDDFEKIAPVLSEADHYKEGFSLIVQLLLENIKKELTV